MPGIQAGRSADESFGAVTSNGDLIVLRVGGGAYDGCFASPSQRDDLGYVAVLLFLPCRNAKGTPHGMVQSGDRGSLPYIEPTVKSPGRDTVLYAGGAAHYMGGSTVRDAYGGAPSGRAASFRLFQLSYDS